ncbi:uncharacterized protein LOC116296066 [Actinia tenebrosa]|uniref:Uncharacterized protein LOC116296066 n=1 Tax=Actinia tenebrosa TaxID=6105 RepID=A0A6P8HU11_ACTTE|nr:uncharacterized protein LOC116296066 [Actinia tenebrosa]
MSEEEVKNTIDELFESALLSIQEPRYEFVRAIGNKIISVPNGPFTGKLVKYLSKQGPVYIRAKKDILHDGGFKRWYKAGEIEIDDDTGSSDDGSHDDGDEPKSKKPKSQVQPSTGKQNMSQDSRTSASTSISTNDSESSTSCSYTNYCNIIVGDAILDSDDENLQLMAIDENLSDSNKEMNGSKDQFWITDQQQDASTRTKKFLSKLQDNGKLEARLMKALVEVGEEGCHNL